MPYWTRQPHWRFRHAWGVASQTGEFQDVGLADSFFSWQAKGKLPLPLAS